MALTYDVRIVVGGQPVTLQQKPSAGRFPICFGRLSADPTPVGVGDTYYNTGDTTWYAWNGATWDALN